MNEQATQVLDAELSELKGRCLMFTVDKLKYSVSLDYVLEIINIQSITFLPGVPNYIKGIINLRGKIVPIIDMRIKLNLPHREYDDKTCIVILDINKMHIGVIVDRVCEVISLENTHLAEPPKVSTSVIPYVSNVFEADNEVVLNLNCEHFFEND